jgi:hypothetical protein
MIYLEKILSALFRSESDTVNCIGVSPRNEVVRVLLKQALGEQSGV